jgi:hypothetical protein
VEYKWDGWHGFNSGCEAGVRANLLGTPTIVWGPGTLEHAHAMNEEIDFRDVQLAAEQFTRFTLRWAQVKEDEYVINHEPNQRPRAE